MSTIKADAIEAATGTNTDLVLTGKGTGVPDIETGFKVSGTAGLPVSDLRVGTDGELITWDASGNPTTVAVGTAAQVLTSNGAGAAPTFQDAAGGAYEFISSVTASSAASVDFDAVFSGSYTNYLMIAEGIIPATDATVMWIRLSTDGGSTWVSSAGAYTTNWLANPASTAVQGSLGHATAIEVNSSTVSNNGQSNVTTDGYSAFSATIYSPQSSSHFTRVVGHAIIADSGDPSSINQNLFAAGRRAAEAHDSIQVLSSSGNISGVFKLYGIKDA
ncbi:MAG TPA: hypothetical protein DCG72_08950 [Gammaproteobacteria bacterium]|jgi:hypothetical protein|nr:hypothetical protein [Gammaproteobacteria bacterium]